MFRTIRFYVYVALVGAFTPTAYAEVRDIAASGFISVHEIQLQGSPKQVWLALTRDIDKWWDASHSYSGEAKNFRLTAKAGGCFCERLKDGGSVEHMRVVYAQPGELLRLSGGLGPLQRMGVQGAMDFALKESDQGTTLGYRYTVTGSKISQLDELAPLVDQVQLGQLKRLQAYLAK